MNQTHHHWQPCAVGTQTVGLQHQAVPFSLTAGRPVTTRDAQPQAGTLTRATADIDTSTT
ncbi:hypothetical protein SMACR_00025 [Sordaria macrospora]|uniref:WGS project CABT00000000 data, contig 2.1 n=2 Tax=Sordaria macrospora TaxID=5147 RepID=F7VJY2_SORMK|nr:uncharacterized protein SMAC_00025 [Sordaria macrospora k-hell]KAA8629097.1 hypothetical protein SMACR_00025 [Sordaria macrospora]WPJ64570.1 hypothetical protein SMAC4_00025 [Sordaria macrospora]CCC05809.1 unnamed protein product [Sordaria macrospora k-hell]